MSIRVKGKNWLLVNLGNLPQVYHVSKFYLPDESRIHKSAWALEFEKENLKNRKVEFIYFLCQKEPGLDDFYCLKVPIRFLAQIQSDLYLRQDRAYFSLHLSAEPERLLEDQRGSGKIVFKNFLVD